MKYEVYGILLITLSVIALSGEATVGRSLSKLFGLLLGKFYFVIALVGIYVGLMVMIKRTWPSGWSTRKSGFLLLVLALTLYSSIIVMDKKTEPVGGLTAGYILEQLGSDVRGALLDSAPASTGSEIDMATKSISGGYAGAFQYWILFLLFGYSGSKFVMIVMFAISFMLMTGMSYVELARTIRTRGGRLLSLLRMKVSSGKGSGLALASAGGKGKTKRSKRASADDDVDEDEEALYEEVKMEPVKGDQKFSLLSWLGFKDEPEAAPEPEAEDDEYGSTAGKKARRKKKIWEEEPEEETLVWDGYAEKETIAAADRAPWEDEPDMSQTDADSAEHTTPSLPETENSSPLISSPALEQEGEETGEAALPPAELVKPYQFPPMSLLAKPNGGRSGDSADANDSRRKLEATLESFGVRAQVLDVVRGPAVTRYEVQPASGVKVSRIVSLTDDIALALAAKDIRMEAPIPGKSAIGIEVPNTEVSMVTMREVMETTSFLNAPSKMSIAFGRDISGQTIVGNLARMPHLLVAGATGSGKSVCINGIITSILYKARPDEVKFLMIDPKMVELNVYNGIPHLLAPVVTDPRRASLALKKIVVEMEKRYELFSKSGTRNIEGYNSLMADNPAAILPFIVVIVDELADLMMVAAGDVEDAICRLAQMARAAGIHLIIATQRPSVDVITGVIKANIPSRIAFGVSSQVDSRTILDSVGAEKLLGRGDMLFLPVGMSKPIRVQGAFLSDQEVEAVVHFVRGQGEAEYKEDLVPEVDDNSTEDQTLDELFDQAVRVVLEAKQASVSLLQRRMRVGYNRAARLIDQMEAKGVIGPYEGSKPREVLMTLDQYDSDKISS